MMTYDRPNKYAHARKPIRTSNGLRNQITDTELCDSEKKKKFPRYPVDQYNIISI